MVIDMMHIFHPTFKKSVVLRYPEAKIIVHAGVPTTVRYANPDEIAVIYPMTIGLSEASVAIFKTIGPSTATAAPLDIIFVTKVVRVDIAAQSPNP